MSATAENPTLVQICDSPVLPLSITVRSVKVRIAGPTGAQPFMYRFRKNGKPTKVTEPEDLEMLLNLTRRTTGPGGKGIAYVQVFEAVTAEKQVQKMTPSDKLTRILELLEQKTGQSIEDLLINDALKPTDDGPVEIIHPADPDEENDADNDL